MIRGFFSRSTFSKLYQRGLTLVEVALVLAIIAVSMAGLSTLLADTGRATKVKAAAERMTEVTAAAENYVSANYTQLIALATSGTPVVIPVGKDCATCAVPTGPGGLPSLQGGGFLSPSFTDTNPFGQRHAVLVREPMVGKLETIVTTYGGQSLLDDDLGRVAAMVGANGGAVYSNSTSSPSSRITGAFGGWHTSTATWAASLGGVSVTPAPGRVQSSLAFVSTGGGGAANMDDYLNRYNTGTPAHNQMQTSIDMNGSDINNGNVYRSNYVATSLDVIAGRHLSSAQNIYANNGSVFAAQNVSGNNSVYAGVDVGAGRNVVANADVVAYGGNVIAEKSFWANTGYVRAATNVIANSGYVWAGTDVIASRNLWAVNIYANGGSAYTTYDVIAGRNVVANGGSVAASLDLSAGRNATIQQDVVANRVRANQFCNYDASVCQTAPVVGVPTGSVFHLAAVTPPPGFLVANGAAVSRTTYAALFATIGTRFGAGDGVTTFNLPDLRGQFIRGWDAAGGTARGVDSGRVFGSRQLDAGQRLTGRLTNRRYHTGSDTLSGETGVFSDGDGALGPSAGTETTQQYYQYLYFDSATSPGARTADETRPENVALLPVIKF